ncbi:MAG: GNAT family N-acetyltransferase [Chloroflexi bacterium]|nr:GNAT family N-acetyltransferase [Chloroflexota bacterium]
MNESPDNLERLNLHWREQLGIAPDDLRVGELRILSWPKRKEDLCWWAFRRRGRAILSVREDLLDEAIATFAQVPVPELFSDANRARMKAIADAHGKALYDDFGPVLYVDEEHFLPAAGTEDCRALGPSEGHLMENWPQEAYEEWILTELRADYAKQPLENRFWVRMEGEVPAAVAWMEVQTQQAWEVGVGTHRDYRRRGYGRAVVSAATKATLDRGLLVVYTTAWTNIASQRLARGLGYIPYGEQVCIEYAK